MKEITKVCLTLGLCTVLWLVNQDLQLNYARAKFKDCYNNAFANYQTRWNSECKADGKKENCRLNAFAASRLDADRNNENNYCLEIFKVDR